MRKIYVDMFFCSRKNVSKAIREYLSDIEKYDGMICPNYILLWDVMISQNVNEDSDVYRLFSVQRRSNLTDEVRVVVNVSRKVKS